MVSIFLYAFLLHYVKTHIDLPIVFIAGFVFFFFIFLFGKSCICGYYGVAKNGKYFSFTTIQLHSMLSIGLNNKRSSTFLTRRKGSHYLNAFHNMFFLKGTWSKSHIINSLEKMFCWKKCIILPGLSQIFLSRDFSRPENLYLIISLVFKLFPVCVGTLRGQRVTVFWWVDFFPRYIFGHKVRETYKTWWDAPDVGPESIYTKQIWNLTKYSSSKNSWFSLIMNMNCFHLLIIAVVPSFRAYIRRGGLISVFNYVAK